MKKILVTGASGFLGHPLVTALRSAGYDVTAIDIPDGDITQESTLEPHLKSGISRVIHLAGKTFVPESWKHPFDYYRVNVMGTVNVLEFCRKSGAGMTYISSYLYGAPDYLPIDEKHPVKWYNPYSHTKVLAEQTCRFYMETFGLHVVILRPFNAYGPGQPAQFLIPEIIKNVLDPSVQKVEVMDLRPKRDYVFIDDLVNAFMKSIDVTSGTYNVGSGYSYSAEDIINLVMKITGIVKPFSSKGMERPNEIFDLYADCTSAGKELNWQPETPFEKGIEACIQFARNRLGG
ncbi:MAG: NAD(P)-dependent oxidoreductase [bacterium]